MFKPGDKVVYKHGCGQSDVPCCKCIQKRDWCKRIFIVLRDNETTLWSKHENGQEWGDPMQWFALLNNKYIDQAKRMQNA